MTQEELGRMLNKAHELMLIGITKKRKPLVRDAMIIFVAIYSGLRRFEICNLQVKDISIGRGRSHLIVRRGKNGKGRTVHIGKDFKRILKNYIRWKSESLELHPNSYLIRNTKSERYTPTGLWKRWRKQAGSNGHRLHDCRHTNASLVYQATRDIRLVSQQLGHSRHETSAIYARVSPEIIQDGMCKMERLAAIAMKRKPAQPSLH